MDRGGVHILLRKFSGRLGAIVGVGARWGGPRTGLGIEGQLDQHGKMIRAAGGQSLQPHERALFDNVSDYILAVHEARGGA